MSRRSSPRFGFTLVELMVVLAILGMLSAIAVPAFIQLAEPNGRERSVTEVRRLLERTRAMALERATRATIVIDPEALRYRLTISRGTSPDSTIEAPLSVPIGVVVRGPTRRPRVTFDGEGRSFGDSIVLVGEGRAMIVGTDPWTGRIYVTSR